MLLIIISKSLVIRINAICVNFSPNFCAVFPVDLDFSPTRPSSHHFSRSGPDLCAPAHRCVLRHSQIISQKYYQNTPQKYQKIAKIPPKNRKNTPQKYKFNSNIEKITKK